MATALSAAMLLAIGCASAGSVPGRQDVGDAIRTRTGQAIRPEPAAAPSVPPNVVIEQGLTREDAVAIALWNSPAFEVTLTDLGLARADLVEARLLRNPILSLLFPWGPKQLEWTVQFPVDTLWQRPRRVAAATFNAQAVGQRLVSEGLALVSDVRTTYVDAVAGESRVALAAENAALARRIADIADARLRAGDISDLEARAARSDAAQIEATLRALESERELAKVTLISKLGLDVPPDGVRLAAAPLTPITTCGTPEALVTDALASRPDVRAAEIGIEAAGQRAAWERSRVVNLIAILDANGQGREGFEMGPGVGGDIPVFARNQGAITRAAAELERASRTYLAVRLQVTSEVRSAFVRFNQAQQALQIWQSAIVSSLETEQRQAESAYKLGEVALLFVLDVNRRLVQARIRELEAGIDLQKAAVALDHRVGRACAGS